MLTPVTIQNGRVALFCGWPTFIRVERRPFLALKVAMQGVLFIGPYILVNINVLTCANLRFAAPGLSLTVTHASAALQEADRS
jgi:hypothetical protein